MTQSDKEKMLSKMAKLRASMESAKAIGNLEEAEVYSEKLMTFMLEHKVTFADLDEAVIDKDDAYGASYFYPNGKKKRRCDWTEHLAMRLGEVCFCKVLVSRASNQITFFGRETDRTLAGYMLEYLATATDIAANRQFRQIPAGERRGFKGEFRYQAAQAVYNRLAKLRVDMVNAATSLPGEKNEFAMVLSTEYDRLEKAYQAHYPYLGRGKAPKSSRTFHAAGSIQGTEFGRKINVHAGITEGAIDKRGLLNG